MNFADSHVASVAWATGRFSAYTTNGSLRRAASWQLNGRKKLLDCFLESAEHISDDPSRFVDLRVPLLKQPWMHDIRELEHVLRVSRSDAASMSSVAPLPALGARATCG